MSDGPSPETRKRRSNSSRILLGILASVLIFFGAFALVEGSASTIIAVWDLSFNPQGSCPLACTPSTTR